MFKVIDLAPEGKLEEATDESRVRPPPDGVFRWVDLVEHDTAALALLQERFNFHPLAIEDCASFELRSKIEDYEGYLFIVLHSFTADPEDPTDIQIHEIHAFLAHDYLVTVHDNPVGAAENVWRRAAEDPAVLAHGPAWILYLTADTMIDQIFPLLSKITDQLEALEESALDRADEDDLATVFHIKRTLVNMRRVIRPARDVINMLSRREFDERIDPKTAIYFRDVYDHIQRCAETIEEARELASNAMDAYQTTITNRTNEVMKKLTIFSAIFLPLSFLTGFWGQNFVDLPVNSGVLFYVMLGAMAVIPAVLLIWFARRNWL